MRYDNMPGKQGLCPPGWHVPTETEWQTLFNYYQGPGFAASPLLSTGYSGFNALVVGVRHQTVQWDFTDFATFFWSSTSHGSFKAWAYGMNNIPDDHGVYWYPARRSDAYSVRCLKD